jgi:hypothetical protein
MSLSAALMKNFGAASGGATEAETSFLPKMFDRRHGVGRSPPAGVALTGLYPEARSASKWLRQAWQIPVAYVVGFFVMLALFGWKPSFH